jgi:Short C-terminal domain
MLARRMFGRRKREKARDLYEHGSRAIGTVMHVQDTGTAVDGAPRVELLFKIEPLDGSPPFDGQKTKVVSRLQIPRAGDRYPVWYDAQDRETFAYATIANDEGRAQIRRLFGMAAETITGIADPAASDPIEQIRELAELRAAGILTEAEFAQKKAELLAQL